MRSEGRTSRPGSQESPWAEHAVAQGLFGYKVIAWDLGRFMLGRRVVQMSSEVLVADFL